MVHVKKIPSIIGSKTKQHTHNEDVNSAWTLTIDIRFKHLNF